ncbi:MAG: substrate-binding domain-containing protein [Actinomycetota bacterium]|nr:substrate-binding domain-containing protein [Actinomycetota bacterium]
MAAGNPLEITGIADLSRPGLRYVNRQRGAGTRVLLDHELRGHGMAPGDVAGYEREEHTHLAVAAAVAAGRVDAGLGIRAAVRPFGLDFVPVAQEPYDLVVTQQTYDSDVLAPLWALLADNKFRDSIDALGGYSTAETGRRIRWPALAGRQPIPSRRAFWMQTAPIQGQIAAVCIQNAGRGGV